MTADSLTYARPTKPIATLRSGRDVLRLAGQCVLAGVISAGVTAIGFFTGSAVALFFSSILSALVLGIGLTMVLKHCAIRHKAVRYLFIAIGAATNVVLFHITMYVHDLYLLGLRLRGSVWRAGVDVLDGHAARIHQLLVPHQYIGGGFVNNIAWRAQHNSGFVKLSLLQMAMTGFFAFVSVKTAGELIWCNRCKHPLTAKKNLLVLPASRGRELVDALCNEDAERITALTQAGLSEALGRSCAIGRLLVCSGCDRQSVDVIVKTFGTMNQAAEKRLSAPIETPSELIVALSSAPAETL